MEEWRDVVGYEGLYQVSSCGRIKSLEDNHNNYRKKILKQCRNKNGYKYVTLCKNDKRKTYLVHRLVANAFLENPNGYPCINHIDEQKYNNFKENLEFCTYKYNSNYGTRSERQSKAMTGKYAGENNPMYGRKRIGANAPRARKVQCINTGKIFNTLTEAANWSGTSRSAIAKQINGKYKTAGKDLITGEKLTWKYLD